MGNGKIESGTQFWRSPQMSRRLSFRHLASGIGGYFLLPELLLTETAARAAASPGVSFGAAKQVIFIMMAGAPSQIDTFDLKEGPWTPRQFEPTSYGDAIRFPRGLMPRIAGELDNVAFLRSVRAWAVVHGLSNQWIQTARSPISAAAKIAPHIGSVVAREFSLRPDAGTPASNGLQLPAFFSLNAVGGANSPGAGFLPASNGPVFLQPQSGGGGLSQETRFMDRPAYARRRDLLQQLEAAGAGEPSAFQAKARDILFNDAVDSIFRIGPEESERFGRSAFGDACVIARNLATAERGIRFVEITFPGWDGHSGLYPSMLQLSREFDDGVGNLIADLRSSSKLSETLVVAMGEFGRTVGPLNSLGGRDHYPQQAVMLAGAGIRGRRAIGETDESGGFTIDPGWSADRNVRPEDIAATIYSALGIDWTSVVRTESGTRYEYVPVVTDSPYRPIEELWS